MKHTALTVLALALMASLFAHTSFAEAPSSEPNCMTFSGETYGKKVKEIAEEDLILVRHRGAAPAVQAWMKEQLSQGRRNFVPVQVFTDTSVLCAW